MLEPTYLIMAEKENGEIFEAFTWCRSKQTGIDRALQDAKNFKVSLTRVWAEPILEEAG